MTDDLPTEDSPRGWAAYYGRRGWRVAPARPGENHPRLNDWPDRATTDAERIDRWWTRSPRDGVCIATGKESDLFVLDVDEGTHKGGAPKIGGDSLCELEAMHGRLPDTYEVCTPSGGRHLYFRYPPDDLIPDGYELVNTASHVAPDLDIRVDRGQVVAPPSERKGGRYERDWGSPEELAEAPAWLVRLACREQPQPREAVSGPARSDRPGDLWAAATPWSDLLGPAGFRLVRTDRAGCSYWSVPGASNQIGATTNNGGRDRLHLFSSSSTWFSAGDDVTKFHALAAIRYGGDHAAAAAWCAEHGFRSDPSEADTVREAGSGAAPTTTVCPSSASEGDADPAGWSEPASVSAEADLPEWPGLIPLSAETELAEFPREIFPPYIEAMIDVVATDLQAPRDLTAMAVLGALMMTVSGRYRIDIDGRQVEELNLYLAAGLPPSSGKSPAYKSMMAPVTGAHAERVRQQAQDVERNASVLRLAKAALKKLEDKGRGSPFELDAAVERVMAARERRTTPEQLYVADATPEALERLIADQHGQVTIYDLEGGMFSVMAGRYSDMASPEAFLKGWSSDPISVARIGRDAVEAPVATLGVSLAVQPVVLEEIGRVPGFSSRGVTARIMYSIPPVLPPWQRSHVRTRVSDADTTIRSEYHARLSRWATGIFEVSTQRRVNLTMSEAALAQWCKWCGDLAERQRPDRDLAGMEEWVSKMTTSVARLAGILHLIHGRTQQSEVGADTMAKAMTVGEYWAAHSAHVHSLWSSTDEVADGRAMLRWVLDVNGGKSFTVRELYRALRKQFPTADSTRDGLKLLIERGWLRTSNGKPLGAAAGNSVRLEVNPLATGTPFRPATIAVPLSVVHVAGPVSDEAIESEPQAIATTPASEDPGEPVDPFSHESYGGADGDFDRRNDFAA